MNLFKLTTDIRKPKDLILLYIGNNHSFNLYEKVSTVIPPEILDVQPNAKV